MGKASGEKSGKMEKWKMRTGLTMQMQMQCLLLPIAYASFELRLRG